MSRPSTPGSPTRRPATSVRVGAAATGLVDFEPDGTLSVVQQGDDGMTVVFWDIDRGEAARTVRLEDPGTPITGAAVSADGALLAG